MPSTIRLLPVAVLACALLAGCDSPAPQLTPPSTAHAPRFATDEEALAAAKKAYAEFLAVSDQIVRDGGANPERLRPHMSDEMYELEVAEMAELADLGRHGVGSTRFTMVLQHHDESSVVTYVCDDQTHSDLVDGSGRSVVNPEGLRRIPFEVVFDASDPMVLAGKTFWRTGGVC